MNPREDLLEGGLRRDLSPVNFSIMTPRIQTVISCLIFLHNLSMIVIVKSKIENTNGNCIRGKIHLSIQSVFATVRQKIAEPISL